MLNVFAKKQAPAGVSIAPAVALPVAVVTAPWTAETDPKVVTLDARHTEISARMHSAKKLMSDAVEKRNEPARKLQALRADNEAGHLAAAEKATLASDPEEVERYAQVAALESEIRRTDDRIAAIEKVCNVKALDAQLHELAVSRGDLLSHLVKQRERSHKDQFLASLVNLIFQRYDLMAKEGLVRAGFSAWDVLHDAEDHVGPAIREVETRRRIALQAAQAA